jgi:hypothetical protein
METLPGLESLSSWYVTGFLQEVRGTHIRWAIHQLMTHLGVPRAHSRPELRRLNTSQEGREEMPALEHTKDPSMTVGGVRVNEPHGGEEARRWTDE